MGELLSFPSRLGYRVRKAGAAASEAAEAKFDSPARRLTMAVDLLDQLTAKIEQMNRLLPTHLVSRFEVQRLEVRDQINHARVKVESLSGFSKD